MYVCMLPTELIQNIRYIGINGLIVGSPSLEKKCDKHLICFTFILHWIIQSWKYCVCRCIFFRKKCTCQKLQAYKYMYLACPPKIKCFISRNFTVLIIIKWTYIFKHLTCNKMVCQKTYLILTDELIIYFKYILR